MKHLGATLIVEADGREYLGTVTSARPYCTKAGTWTTVYTIAFSQGCERGRVRVDAATLEECLRTRQPVWA